MKRLKKNPKTDKKSFWVGVSLLGILAISLLSYSISLFADFVGGEANIVIGKLDLVKIEESTYIKKFFWPGPEQDKIGQVTGDSAKTLEPGDVITISHTFENRGDKAAWIRTYTHLSVLNNSGEPDTTLPQGAFIFYEYTGTASEGTVAGSIQKYHQINGFPQEPLLPGIQLLSGNITNGIFISTGKPKVLNGRGANAETIGDASAEMINGNNSVTSKIFLLFLGSPSSSVNSNAFQGKNIKFTFRTDGVQYRNNTNSNKNNALNWKPAESMEESWSLSTGS